MVYTGPQFVAALNSSKQGWLNYSRAVLTKSPLGVHPRVVEQDPVEFFPVVAALTYHLTTLTTAASTL